MKPVDMSDLTYFLIVQLEKIGTEKRIGQIEIDQVKELSREVCRYFYKLDNGDDDEPPF